MTVLTESSLLGMSRGEKISVFILYAAILVATLLGFAVSAIMGRTSEVLAGLGLVAFILGLRHGLDADHIAAIDNTTRKLMQEGKRPLTVGTWFSLGHSTIVVALIVLLVLSTRTITGAIPALQSEGAILGTAVSGTFLWIIGLVNVLIALEIYRIFREMRSGRLDHDQLEDLLNKRGFLNRYFYPLFKLVRKPWQIYPVGVLFGLGFDTASEVALIAISVGVGVSASVPLWMVLVLPFMFTCGMVLADTTDGVTMALAYGWAFLKPTRKVYYNLTITIISILVAFVVGAVEVLQVFSNELNLSGGVWRLFNGIDFESLGFVIVAIFAASWLVSIAIYKYKRLENVEERIEF